MSGAALYARAFTRGATHRVTLDRADGSASAAGVRAKLEAHHSADLVGALQSDSYSAIVLAADLAAFGSPRAGDWCTVDGRKYRIRAADGASRAQAGVTLAYVLDLSA